MKKIIFVFILIIIIFAVVFIISSSREKQIKEELNDNMTGSVKIDLIVVEKAKRILSIYDNGSLIKSYKISLGKNPVGHKQFEGDSKTPEGVYYIDGKNPKSKYFLNLGISYPSEKDKEYAASQGKSAGGDIKIHGLPNGFSLAKPLFDIYGDWTQGCIAVNNEDMAELYNIIEIGTKIEIKP